MKLINVLKMKDKIKCLINRYWKFDDQTPMSNWHDKQDLLNEIEKLFESEQSEIVPIGTKVRVKICKLSDEMTIIKYDANREEYICQVLQIQVGLKREEFEIIEQ